jgi:hypothetical protein
MVRLKANAIFIPDGDDIENRPWCSKCSAYYRYFDEPKTWSCSGCGDVLDRRKKLQAKATDSDIPNPMVGQHKSSKSKRRTQDYPPGVQITEEKELNPATGEWKDIE